MLAQKIFWCNR